MVAKLGQILIKPVDGEFRSESVCDFDELDEILQTELADIRRVDTPVILTVDSFSAALVDASRCNVVKLTDYYEVRRV